MYSISLNTIETKYSSFDSCKILDAKDGNRIEKKIISIRARTEKSASSSRDGMAEGEEGGRGFGDP